MENRSNFKVIIVGGGIGGLAFANCLQHSGIDYVLLEKGSEIDPQVGASIGILPNGARILDQLGCYDDLVEATVSMATTATHRHDGSVIGGVSDTLQLMEHRTGYPVLFIDRQLLLRILGDHIIDHEKILLNSSVRSVEESQDEVVVHCKDGTSIRGDIVVGADGVHSPVRHAMWQHAEASGQGERFRDDKNAMSAEYKCLFGISKAIPGMMPSQTDRTYAKGMSTLSYVGKEGRVFWFVFIKMDNIYYPPDIPKFNKDDAAALVKEIGSVAIRENGSVNIRDLYDSHVACSLVAIEEAQYQHWSFGRSVCLGDSIHKMTPNLGAGASSAMESAAVLSNVLVELTKKTQNPSIPEITKAFDEYRKTQAPRVARTMAFTNTLTRVQALKGPKEYVYTHFIAPRSNDSAAEMFSSFVIGAPLLKYLPVPMKSLQGTMPFNPRHGWGFEEAKSRRALLALPLLILSILHCLQNYWNSPTPGNSTQAADSLSRPMPMYEDAMYAIWLMESTRLNNQGTLSQLPLLFGLATQRFGVGAVAPLYFFFLFIRTPVESFRASDNRLTNKAYAASTGPLLVAFRLVLEHYRSCATHSACLLAAKFLTAGKPFVLSISQFLLARSFAGNSMQYDRLWAVRNDVKWIRRTIGALIGVSIGYRLYRTYFDGPSSISWALDLINVRGGENLDQLYFTAGIAIWLGLAFRDLWYAGMLQGPVKVFVTLTSVLMLLGPTALLGAGWLWREEILINCRHKDAVIEESK